MFLMVYVGSILNEVLFFVKIDLGLFFSSLCYLVIGCFVSGIKFMFMLDGI